MNEEGILQECFTPAGVQRGLVGVYMAGQAPGVELTLPSCFRESWDMAGHVTGNRGPTHMKRLASMLKVNGANCGSPQGLGGGGEDLNSSQIKGSNYFLIFTFLRILMRFYLLRNPEN